jgi:hypothetical protein
LFLRQASLPIEFAFGWIEIEKFHQRGVVHCQSPIVGKKFSLADRFASVREKPGDLFHG